MTIKLTDAERLILANQYEIMGMLDPSQRDELNRIADNLRRGHEPLYRMVLDPLQRVLSEDNTGFVHHILALYGRLRDNYDALPDKGTVEASQVRWPGFDGNNESELLSYTRALCAEGSFQDVLGSVDFDVPNSHITMTDSYTRMLGKWRELGEPNQLDLAQITAIIGARRYQSQD